jgi:cutinase
VKDPKPKAIPASFGKTPVKLGPKPSGCSKFEILVGQLHTLILSFAFDQFLMVFAARGTSEPGPFGVIAGDPLVKNVVAAVPGARGYAVQVRKRYLPSSISLSHLSVQYPAVLSAESVAIGAKDVVDRLTSQHAACPTQKFALVGYSQGARVMRAASVKLNPAILPDIVALVMFGDRGMRDMNITQFPPVLQKRLHENCAPRDPVS